MLRIRARRQELGWTLRYVGSQVGVTEATAQQIETGRCLPSFRILVKLEDLFGMDYRDLFNLPQRQLREQQNAPADGQADGS